MKQRTNIALSARFAGLGIAAATAFALASAPVSAWAADGEGDLDLADDAAVEQLEETDDVSEAEGNTTDEQAVIPEEQEDEPFAADDAGQVEEISEDDDLGGDQFAEDEDSAVEVPTEDEAVVEDEQSDDGKVPAGDLTEQAEGEDGTSDSAMGSSDEVASEALVSASAPATKLAKAGSDATPTEEGEETVKNGLVDGIYYKNGEKYTGWASGVYYKNGKTHTGWTSDNKYYVKSGKKYTGFVGGHKYYVKKGEKVTGSHKIEDGVLYNIKSNGSVTKVNFAGRNYYRCADGYIFFSPSKASGKLATGKKGWATSSSYGVKGGRYYFRTTGGYLYTKYGFSMAGKNYGVLTGKKGNARTKNRTTKSGRKYLINSKGQMLVLTAADKKTYGYTTMGFKWAKRFGDGTCSETFNTRELYFLHEDTSADSSIKGAYYVKFKKGKIKYEKAGNGLKYKNAAGNTATYKGAHANTDFGFVLRAVNDNGHNVTVKGNMPVVYNNEVYMADANGQLTKGATWSSNQRKAVKVANKQLRKGKGRYGFTVSKTTHTVYLWYCNGKKWLPLFETPCSTGREDSYDTPEGTVREWWTPTGYSTTYDHQKYFSGCTYYATGYKKSEKSGWHLHSTIYQLSTGRRTDSRLRKNISNGCIRVNINYARYVYKYIPLKTQFYVY